MKRKGLKKTIASVLAAASVLCALSGCTQEPSHPAAPPVSPAPVEHMSSQDSFSAVEERFILYIPDEESMELNSRVETLSYPGNVNPAGPLVKRLMDVFKDETALMPRYCYADRVEVTCGIALAYFTGDITDVSPLRLFLFRAAVINTLTQLSDVSYVNIYFNDKLLSVPGVMPGISSTVTGELDALWLQAKERAAVLEALTDDPLQTSANVTYTETVQMALYFTDITNTYLIPEVRTVKLDLLDPVPAILEELRKGPQNVRLYSGLLSENTQLAASYEEYNELLDGQTLTLDFASAPDTSTLSTALVYGSIVLTLSGVTDTVDGYDFLLNGQRIPIGERASEEAPLLRRQYTTRIGSRITLYFPDDRYSRLVAVTRVIPQDQACDPRMVLTYLTVGLQTGDPGQLKPVFPTEVTAADILSVETKDGIIRLNLSQNAADSMQGMTADREAAFVFAVVNTLTELRLHTQVQFFVEHTSIETLAGHMSLRGALLPNPGMVRSGDEG